MVHLISALFIIEFFLILIIMLYTLLKKGATFKVGVSFGVLFFVFIPVWIMILTGTLELSKADFSYTTLTDVVLNNNIHSSLLLLGYLFSILLYLYFPSRYSTIEVNDKFKPSSKAYLTIYTIGMLIVFIGSGLLEGGDWYQNREHFMQSNGALAVLIVFLVNSAKILLLSTLFYKWLRNDFSFYKFMFFILLFVIIDMVF